MSRAASAASLGKRCGPRAPVRDGLKLSTLKDALREWEDRHDGGQKKRDFLRQPMSTEPRVDLGADLRRYVRERAN